MLQLNLQILHRCRPSVNWDGSGVADAVQDVRMIFEMFDSNNDGTMDIAEFENITDNLRRQGKLSPGGATRTGFKENAE